MADATADRPQKSTADSLEGSPKTPTRFTPSRVKLPTPSHDVSPYRSFRPKFLPKNGKLHKRKHEERKQYLESIKAIERKWEPNALEKLMLTPEKLLSTSMEEPNSSTTPLIRCFCPEKFYTLFDEERLNVDDFVPSDSPMRSKNCTEIITFLRSSANYTPTAAECRFFFYWLSVTKKRYIVNFVLSLFHSRLLNHSLYLGWKDLQKILINFGLTKEPPRIVGSSSEHSHPSPQPWNLEFLLFLLENSFKEYQSHLQFRLFNFLMGSVFDPLFASLKIRVASIANQVVAELILNKVTPNEIFSAFEFYFHFNPIACNRFIFQMMSSNPALYKVTKLFAIKIIEGAVEEDAALGSDVSVEQILDFLFKHKESFVTFEYEYVSQVVMIVEKFLLWEKSKSVQLKGGEKLLLFCQTIRQHHHRLQCLYLDEISRRIQSLLSVF